MGLADACARMSNIAVGPTIVSPAELQNLQLEGGDDDASSSSSEEEVAAPALGGVSCGFTQGAEQPVDWVIHREYASRAFRIERQDGF